MNSKEILRWFDLEQGTATPNKILAVWRHFPDYDTTSSNVPGLPEGQHYGIYSAMKAIGCVPKEGRKYDS